MRIKRLPRKTFRRVDSLRYFAERCRNTTTATAKRTRKRISGGPKLGTIAPFLLRAASTAAKDT
jgi:hypothetical protein